MKHLLSFYYWTVGGIAFGLILIFAILATFFIPEVRYDPWIKKMLRGLFKIFHTKVESQGEEQIRTDKPYLFMANHVSIFDVILLGGFIPIFVRGVEAERQHKWPLYGWAAKRYGNISINREDVYSSMKSLRKAEKYLQEGKSIIMLPDYIICPSSRLFSLVRFYSFFKRGVLYDRQKDFPAQPSNTPNHRLVAAGVYFCRMEARGFVQTIKLALVR